MHCDIWATGYDVLPQRTGQTLWSHQYGHNQCPVNDKADESDKQAAAMHPLQWRPCVLRTPGEPLAPSGSRNVRPPGNAEGAAEQQPISAPQQEGTWRRPRESEKRTWDTRCQTKRQYGQFASAVTSFGDPKRSANVKGTSR